MHSFAALLVLMSLSIPAYADMSAADKAAIDVQHKARIDAAAKEKARQENLKRQNEALQAGYLKESTGDMRKLLGKSAEGKSDAEVRRMYQEKGARDGQSAQQKEVATRTQRDTATRNVTGKSLKELENMSDKDLDKLARDLEKKYGK